MKNKKPIFTRTLLQLPFSIKIYPFFRELNFLFINLRCARCNKIKRKVISRVYTFTAFRKINRINIGKAGKNVKFYESDTAHHFSNGKSCKWGMVIIYLRQYENQLKVLR